MTDKAVQYYLDKDKLIDIRVDHWDNGKMYVSVYNDRNDSCVAYTCSREELKGLADFLYKTIEEKEMNWHYNNPTVNGEYICCVKGSSCPRLMAWHEGKWGYYMDDGDFMLNGFDNEDIVCYIDVDEIPMPENW